MVKGRFALAIVVIGTLVLAACGGGGGDTANVSLDQSFSGGGISFNYPGGWVIEEQAGTGVLLATSQSTLEALSGDNTNPPGSGEFGAMFMVLPTADIAALYDPATARVLLEDMFLESLSQDEDVTFSEPVDVTIGGKTAARVDGADDEGDAAVIVVEIGEDALVVMILGASSGEMGNFNGTVEGIIESLSYQG